MSFLCLSKYYTSCAEKGKIVEKLIKYQVIKMSGDVNFCKCAFPFGLEMRPDEEYLNDWIN
jgi:hypothetical protein